MWGSNPRPPA